MGILRNIRCARCHCTKESFRVVAKTGFVEQAAPWSMGYVSANS